MNTVITGTSRGIGPELASQALKRGHRLSEYRDFRRAAPAGAPLGPGIAVFRQRKRADALSGQSEKSIAHGWEYRRQCRLA